MKFFLVSILLLLNCSLFGQGLPFTPQYFASLNQTNAVAGGGGTYQASLLSKVTAYWKLDETSGSRGDSDTNGTAQTLTANGAPGSAAGVVSNAVTLASASSQYLNRSTEADLCATNAFTWAGWVYFSTTNATQVLSGKYNTTGNQRSWLVEWFPTANHFVLVASTNGTGSTALTNSSGVIPSTGTWYFVACGYDGSNLYIQSNNGTVDSVAFTGSLFQNSESFRIGASGNGNYQDGRSDEIYWANQNWLTSEERTALYNGGVGTTYPFTGL